MDNKNIRKTCVLYTTATCNLKCKYCYIDKSPLLIEIDKLLEESYKDDYYFNFMKEMFSSYGLERVECWGGEPTYGLVRAISTLQKALNYFPNLNQFMFSTNLTTSSCVEDIFNFYEAIAKTAPERRFIFDLQLSIDGPQYINDFNRGVGTTEKFTKNFVKLLLKAKDWLPLYPNVILEAHFKPTLDIEAISQLQTKEKIIEYYQFLDEYKKISDSVVIDVPNWNFVSVKPNTATPAPHDQQSGKEFANMCKLINEIMEENNNYFYSYTDIMPFRYGKIEDDYTLCHGCGTCGTGSTMLGLLPNDMISACHSGFTELIEAQKKKFNEEDFQIDIKLFFKPKEKNILIFNKEEYITYEKGMTAYCDEALFQVTEVAAMIKQIAHAGQIDKKYLEDKEAVNAAHFIQRSTASCLRDNTGISGSRYLQQVGYIRLFLNGAREEIQKYTYE